MHSASQPIWSYTVHYCLRRTPPSQPLPFSSTRIWSDLSVSAWLRISFQTNARTEVAEPRSHLGCRFAINTFNTYFLRANVVLEFKWKKRSTIYFASGCFHSHRRGQMINIKHEEYIVSQVVVKALEKNKVEEETWNA